MAKHPKFEVYTGKNGEHYFRLTASNGEPILGSEGYKSKESCLNGIDSVKRNGAEDARYEKKETAGGKFMFNLKATNGQVIGTSQQYATESGRDNGIESVKKNSQVAEIEDEGATA
jgi:uncharacterized protein YegP (UPF0339 family)